MPRLHSLFFALLALPAAAAEPLHVLIATDPGRESNQIRDGLAAAVKQGGGLVETAELPGALPLDHTDVLVVYEREFRAFTADERAAVEAFAKKGGGIVALHGGLAAGDEAWWKPLVGGAWTADSQKFSSRMMLYVATDQHPIVAGASAFDIDDETGYDLSLAANVRVLASAFTPKITGPRAEARRNRNAPAEKANVFDIQPQLWAYEAPAENGGKPHRAVAALQGEPATFNHPSFRTFLLRGIAWTAGRNNLDELSAAAEVASLRYPPGGPETAEATVKQFKIEPGFTASVAAEEPLINKPIAVQWDGSGRLWVAETPEYPNGRRPMVAEPWKETDSLVPGVSDRAAKDRISVLSEPDANGKFTKKTVFYEGLELVTGFCLYRDGVIALHEPDIVWLRDTKGTGKADTVQRLFTGFTPGDTHFVANHLILAPDGWVYVSMGGGADVRKPEGGEVIARISSGMFRFKPDGSAIEQVSSKGGNGFGADVTSDGELFFNQATSGNPIQHVALPESVLARGKVGSQGGAQNVIEQRVVARNPLPSRIPLMQIDLVGKYSAACASLVYEGGAWPAEWNRSIFCTEPILNIIHREALVPKGPTFTGNMVRTDAEFIYSPDYWFRPVDVAPGPDGAIYLLDFYNPVIAHSDTRGPLHSRSGASVRPDREHYFGRIYRVQSDQARKLEIPDLAKADAAQLVQAFHHPNRTVRFNAHRLLMERSATEAVPALLPVATQDAFAPARSQALWGLQRFGALEPALLKAALTDGDPVVRKTAALIAETRADADAAQAELAKGALDSDPRTRIAMLRGLAATGVDAVSAQAIVAAYAQASETWTQSAAVAAAMRNPAAVIDAAFSSAKPDGLRDLVSGIAARLVESRQPAAFGRLISVISGKPAATDSLKRLVLEAAARLKLSAGEMPEAPLLTLLGSENLDLRTAALPVAAAIAGSGALHDAVEKNAAALLAKLGEPGLSDDAAKQIVASLVGARAANAAILPAIGKLLADPKTSEGLKREAISALGQSGDAVAGALLTDSFASLAPSVQTKAYDALLTRAEWANAFLDAVEAGKIRISDLGPANVFRLTSHPVKAVAERATKAVAKLRSGSGDKDAVIAQLRPIVTQAGNAAHGKEVFTQTCAICHKYGDVGKEIGPVLDGIGAHGPEALLIDIIDPSRQIDAGFELFTIETKDGQIQSGILAQENDARVILRSPAGDVEIPTAQIKSRVNTHRSLMPEGFEGLGGETLRDILAFLCGSESRFRVLNLAEAFTADTRRGLYQSQDAPADSFRFAKYGMNNVDGIPFNIVNPEESLIGGNIIVLKGGPPDAFAHTLPRRVEVKVGLPVTKFDFLGGVAGWGASAPDPSGRTIMRVTMYFADGQTETVSLRNGVEFADYGGAVEVPGSKMTHGVVTERQLRWFSIPVSHPGVVEKLALESADNGPAPTTVAITAELAR